MVNVPSMRDMLQEFGDTIEDIPEIRVWVHPGTGDDFYETFNSFKEAIDFIKENPRAEKQPLIAWRGYELNLWAVEKLAPKTK